jgi:hypothetical protein
MEIHMRDNKVCTVCKELIENPTDRKAQRNFAKKFGNTIIKALIKVSQKIKSSENASIYNQTSSSDNTIQLVSNVKAKDPVALKVRIQDSYRKFFYFYAPSEEEAEFSLRKDWHGQFDEITRIYVYEFNKHNYSKA